MLLPIISNEQNYLQDREIRTLLTYLAVLSETNNVDVHFDMDNNGFSPRYSLYLQELQKIPLPRRETKILNITK